MGETLSAASVCDISNVLDGEENNEEGPEYGLIWLHGLGDTEVTWRGLIEQSLSPDHGPCYTLFPRAPVRPVSVERGSCIPSWFDMKLLPLTASDNPPTFGCCMEDAEESATTVHRLIQHLSNRGVKPKKVFVGGFAQGGALALLSSLTYGRRLAGCIVFNGFLLGADVLEEMTAPKNRELNVLWCHGVSDKVIHQSLQRFASQVLQRAGVHVESRSVPTGHEAHPDGLAMMARFVGDRLESTQNVDERRKRLGWRPEDRPTSYRSHDYDAFVVRR